MEVLILLIKVFLQGRGATDVFWKMLGNSQCVNISSSFFFCLATWK